MHKSYRGQTSVEYILLLSISVVFFLVIILVAYDQFANVGQVKSRDISVNSLKQIADAAKEVYLQGSGARKTVRVTFPPEVEDDSITIANNSFHVNHAGTDISFPMDFQIYGIMPVGAGTYEIILVSEGSQVRIGTADFSVSPSYFTFSFCTATSSQISTQNLTFANLQNYSINIPLAVDWTYPNVTINVSNSSLQLAAYGSQTITVSAIFGANITGTYSGFITADAANSSTSIPITVATLDCVFSGTGAATNATGTNASYMQIRTYSNSSYSLEKVAFDLLPNATITTGYWPPNSMITIDLKDPTNISVSGYPKNVQVNSTGGYSEQWSVPNVYGFYTIIANDSTTTTNKTISVIQCS